jgi:hypothetical protein
LYQRPLGIAALEDKIIQAAVVAAYERLGNLSIPASHGQSPDWSDSSSPANLAQKRSAPEFAPSHRFVRWLNRV